MKKYIVVTGGAGFIGSHIVDRLIADGHEVTVIDNETSDAHEQFYYNDNATYCWYDVQDYHNIEHLFEGVDWVFHLAAESRIIGSTIGKKSTPKSLLNFFATSRESSRCCFWSSPTGT